MKTYKVFLLLFLNLPIYLNAQDSLVKENNKRINIEQLADTIRIKRTGQIHIWVENGWVNVEKIDAHNQLIFRTILYRYNNIKPKIQDDGWDIKVSSEDAKYFINIPKYEAKPFVHNIINGVQEDVLDNSEIYFNPKSYKVTPVHTVSENDNRKIWKWEKDGWEYFSIGKENSPGVVGIFRIKHNIEPEDNTYNYSNGLEIVGNHHFFWNGNLFYAEYVPLERADSLSANIQKLKVNFPPELEAIKWYNIKTIKLSLGKLKGKIIILYFWATWCYGCLPKMPLLESYYEKYENRGLVIIGVHHNKLPGMLEKYISENPDLKFPVCIATEQTLKNYQVVDIPKTFIINREGKIIKAFLERIPNEQEIKSLLSSK